MNTANRVLAAADPFEGVRDFDVMVNRLFNGHPQGIATPYAVDVREDADHIFVDADLPGFTKDQIDITMENGVLSILAERNNETNKEPAGEYLLNERRYSKFQRSFKLPPTVDGNTVQAALTDGVLHITLNKREDTKPRKIKVS